MIQKQHKLDIFKTLSAISTKNVDFYKGLTEEEQKGLHPLVVMRWLSGTRDSRQIYFLNELVNPFVFSLPHHKELLVDLMTICSSGKDKRYFWTKTKGKGNTKMPITVGVIRDYFGYNTTDSIQAIPLLSSDDILSYAEQLGRQSDDISKIKKEIKNR